MNRASLIKPWILPCLWSYLSPCIESCLYVWQVETLKYLSYDMISPLYPRSICLYAILRLFFDSGVLHRYHWIAQNFTIPVFSWHFHCVILYLIFRYWDSIFCGIFPTKGKFCLWALVCSCPNHQIFPWSTCLFQVLTWKQCMGRTSYGYLVLAPGLKKLLPSHGAWCTHGWRRC